MSEKQLVNLEPGTSAATLIDSLDAILDNIKKKVPVHDKDLKKKSDRQEIISDAYAIRKSKTFLSDTIDGLIEEQKKKIEPITNVIAQLKDSKKKSDKTLKLLAEETRACVTDWEAEQKRIADEEDARAEAEELAEQVVNDHEFALMMADKFDRELQEAREEAARVANEKHKRELAIEEGRIIAREKSARAEAEAKAEREKRELLEREAIAKEQVEQAKRSQIAAEERAKVQAEQAEIARVAAEKQAAINAKAEAEKARGEEIARQIDLEEAIEDAARKRLADKKHISIIRGEAKLALIGLGLSEGQAKKVVMAITCNEIPHIKITY